MNRFFCFLFLISLPCFSFDTYKLKNDKDVLVRDIGLNDINELKLSYSKADAEDYFESFSVAIQEFIKKPSACSSDIAESLRSQALGFNISAYEFIQVLRVYNEIDDIMYALAKEAIVRNDTIEQAKANTSRIRNYRHLFTPRVLKKVDLNNTYDGLVKGDVCIEDSLKKLLYIVKKQGLNASYRQINLLNHKAYRAGLLKIDEFKSLQALNSLRSNELGISFGKYFEIVQNAKNKMQSSNSESIEDVQDIFVSQYHDRHQKLTRRIQLYRRFNSTQIVMLAKILERASIRMGIDPNTQTQATRIVTDYVTIRDGVEQQMSDVYILSPSEQFEFARKRLRKDIFELVGRKTFSGVKVNYEDIVVAALETGYINHSDIKYVIEFDDLWNPNISAWDKYKEFAWSFAGEASFFLPAPYNIVGAIGLVFLNSRYANKGAPHENHANPGNIFH